MSVKHAAQAFAGEHVSVVGGHRNNAARVFLLVDLILDFLHVSFAQTVFVLQHQLFDLLCFLAAPPLDERVDVI